MRMDRGTAPFARRAGFTMVELIVVLVLMGIVGAVAASSMPDGEDRALPYEFTMLKTHIRYAQARAMGQNAQFGIRVNNGRYFLFRGTDRSDRLLLPNQDALRVPLTCSVSPGSLTIAFDGRGRPYDSHRFRDRDLLAAAMGVTLSHDGESRSFSITPGTGYIP